MPLPGTLFIFNKLKTVPLPHRSFRQIITDHRISSLIFKYIDSTQIKTRLFLTLAIALCQNQAKRRNYL